VAQPTRRDYIIVTVAFLVLVPSGGWLAANWRPLAAGYYIRQAENLRADPATVRRALARAGNLDRRQLVRFWEREIAALNRAEAARNPPPTGAPYVTVEAERCVLEPGGELRLTAVLQNPTDRELRADQTGWAFLLYHSSSWAAARRRPEEWSAVDMQTLVPLLDPARSEPRRIAPHATARDEYLAPMGGTGDDVAGTEWIRGPGLHQFQFEWVDTSELLHNSVGRIFILVLPRAGQADEWWEPPVPTRPPVP